VPLVLPALTKLGPFRFGVRLIASCGGWARLGRLPEQKRGGVAERHHACCDAERRRKRRTRNWIARVAEIDRRTGKLVGRLKKDPSERERVLERLRKSLDRWPGGAVRQQRLRTRRSETGR
jgi:hypothetical protein